MKSYVYLKNLSLRIDFNTEYEVNEVELPRVILQTVYLTKHYSEYFQQKTSTVLHTAVFVKRFYLCDSLIYTQNSYVPLKLKNLLSKVLRKYLLEIKANNITFHSCELKLFGRKLIKFPPRIR